MPCGSFRPPVGGGFGSKLDLSVQPFVALAAWLLGRPAAMVYTRPESIASTTKRHPARMRARMAADADGRLLAMEFDGAFNTGAYASWGPTVANRVPVHASGPYVVPQLPRRKPRGSDELRACRRLPRLRRAADRRSPRSRCWTCWRSSWVSTRWTSASPMRSPIRHRPSPARSWATASASVPASRRWCRIGSGRAATRWPSTRASGRKRRGAGVAGMFYGCGNTSLPNPSTIRIGLKPDGRIALHQGAVDIGQGSNTVIAQIAADALGLPLACFDLVARRHRSHARLRQDIRIAPDLCHRQSG